LESEALPQNFLPTEFEIIMDFISKVTGNGDGKKSDERKADSGSFMGKISSMAGDEKKSNEKKEGGGGFMDKINSMAGGGQESEKQEDGLDKGMTRMPTPRPPSATSFSNLLRKSRSTNEALEQPSTTSKNAFSVRATSPTNPLSSRARTRRFPTLYGTSTRRRRGRTFLLPIRTRSTVLDSFP
jgi:hypothetical protein